MNTYSKMVSVTNHTFGDKILKRAKSDRRKRATYLLEDFVYEERPDLATGLLLCGSTDRDWDLESEFKREAAEYVYNGMGLGFLAWLILKPFIFWALEQIIEDLLTA
jgi:hypothetical protein